MAAAAAEALQYIAVDDLPEVAIERQIVREHAWNTIETRRQHVQNGEAALIPLQVDALTTAQKVIDAKQQYGENSQQYYELRQGLQLDCSRLVAEWFRKNKPEYFPLVRHVYDPTTEDFYSHGLSLRQMTENALTPHNGNAEEEARRVNERVEEATPHLLRKMGNLALEGTRIRTVSECTDQAIADYQYDINTGAKHRGYAGYVPEIEKVMIRDVRLDDTTNDRFEEQVGLPGIYITHDIIKMAIQRRGVDVTDKDKTALHGTQLVAHDDLIDFVELLDTVATEQWCTPVFMGEPVEPDHPRDYHNIRVESEQRQKELAAHSRMVADFIIGLAEDHTDPRKAPEIIETFVKKILLNMVRDDITLAPQIFDEKTAAGLLLVAEMEAQGRSQEAFLLLQKVESAAPGGGYCGAGSCGLEAIYSDSKDEEAVRKIGFGNTKDVLKDTERKCKCGAKTVYYDLKKAMKGCTTCGKTAKY